MPVLAALRIVLRAITKAPLGGPVTIRIQDQNYAISLELARMVTVLPDRIAEESEASEAVAAASE